MKFGVCKTHEFAKQIKEAGYDFIEVNLTKISAMTEDEFSECASFLKEAGLEAKSANCFFPSDIKLVGDDVDYDRIKQYTEFALSRAHALGIGVTVLGSGKSRSVAEGYDRAVAAEQFKNVVKICSDVARKYGIKIAIEALSQRDTNFLNTVAQTAEICDALGLDNVGITADFFHIYMNGEGLDGLEAAKRHIFHLHIAKPNENRFAPTPDDADTLKKWAQSVKNIGYDLLLSLESTSKQDFETAIKDMSSVKYIFE